jgi:hypothetical protein
MEGVIIKASGVNRFTDENGNVYCKTYRGDAASRDRQAKKTWYSKEWTCKECGTKTTNNGRGQHLKTKKHKEAINQYHTAEKQ